MNHPLSYIISFPIIIAAIFLMLLDLALSPFVFLTRQLLNRKIIVPSKAIEEEEMKDEMQEVITSNETAYKKIGIKKNYKNNGSMLIESQFW